MYRGGLTSAVALTPYGANEVIFKSTNTAGTDQTNAHGIDGGYPGAGSQVGVIRNSAVWERIAAGAPPISDDEFAAPIKYLPSKAEGVLEPGDVFVFFAAGGGGYGDPLDRNPEAVASDIAQDWVSVKRAKSDYGVSIADDGSVDPVATEALRTEIRSRRKKGRLVAWEIVDEIRGDSRIGENLLSRGGKLICRRCEAPLTGKLGHVVEATAPLAKAGPWIALRWNGDTPNFSLSEITCPDCGTLQSVTEVRT